MTDPLFNQYMLIFLVGNKFSTFLWRLINYAKKDTESQISCAFLLICPFGLHQAFVFQAV
ncbi:MAG TPA: hypothetical protein DHW25_10855 [Blautia sp.]|nr:hypothetical protein [Blautia sp.]